MNSVLSSLQSLMQMFDGKGQEFMRDIDNVHMVWLDEIQQEANHMFSRDFNAEPELMPKTPSQKKNSRRKRVSLGRQEENQARRRFSKGKRSNLRGSSIKALNFITEEETIPEASTSEGSTTTQPKRTTRKNKQTKPEVAEDVSQSPRASSKTEEVQNKKLELVEDEEADKNRDVNKAEVEPEGSTSTQPKRTTRKNKQTKPDVAEDVSQSPRASSKTEEVQNKKPNLVDDEEVDKKREVNNAEVEPDYRWSTSEPPPKIPSPDVVVSISPTDRLSAELVKKVDHSPGRTAAKIAIAGTAQSSRRSSVQYSLKVRHSLAGLRHSMTQESVRRASRRSMLKRKVARNGNSTCSSNVDDDSYIASVVEDQDGEPMLEAGTADMEVNAAAEESKETPEKVYPSLGRITRSVAANSPKLAPQAFFTTEQKVSTPCRRPVVTEKQQNSQSSRRSNQSNKRKAPDTVEDCPTKRLTPPKKSQTAVKPNMRSFLHTVQKNQMLMMTPNSLGRTAVIKSFIKHTTPLKTDPKTKERHKLEALKKKQEQEEERMKKMEEDKKKKQEELKRKRDERLRRVFEAKVKEEQREEEKKKKMEQRIAQIEIEKRQAEEKAKKKAALKRQEELELKRKLEDEARKKKIQQAEEEKRQQELLAKKKAEEEELRGRKLAEARRALELKREQEREKERQAAAERERVEREKALALQQELERAAREKERRELEEKRKREEQQRLAAQEKAAKEREAAAKQAAQTAAAGLTASDIERTVMTTPVGKAGLNVTVDIEKSPQSYSITPKGGNKPLIMPKVCAENYGMDQNSDDSTDDESAPRKPIPSWAEGHNLQQIIMKQYFNPPGLDSFFGTIEPPNLESIFYKSKPRYFKRTSSAVWHSPPITKM